MCHAYKGAEIILSTTTQVTCILLLCNNARALTIPQSLFYTADAREVASFNIMADKGVSDPGSKSLDSCIIHKITVRKGLQLTWPKGLSIPFIFLMLRAGKLLSQLVRVSCIKVLKNLLWLQ